MEHHTNDQFISHALKAFKIVLGKDHAKLGNHGIELTFNLSDARQKQLFSFFGTRARESKLIFDSNQSVLLRKKLIITETPEDKVVTLNIPLPVNNSKDIAIVASLLFKDADLRYWQNEYGETRCMVVSGDEAYPLVEITGTPWERVVRSRYETPVLEPKLAAPVEPQLRNTQESSLGYALLSEGNTRIPIREWIIEQGKVEKRKGLPPRTAIPTDWVKTSAIAELQHDPKMQSAIKKTFSRE